jgi:L-ascorbate metabolism protein UlaG (beta-lactamase superfamily)
MKSIIFSIALVLSLKITAFALTSDKIDTSEGPLTIHPISHATFAMTWNNKTIYVDPTGGAAAFSNQSSPDIILITDIHGDHLQTETLKEIETSSATFIVPQAVADKLPGDLSKNTIILRNGDSKEVKGISVEAIPMYNLPESEDAFHPKGRGNGYVLEMGGKRIYLSGDTEGTPEMRSLKNIDIAFVCMNLPYTMDVDQAANAVLEFKPKIVYPYHFRGQGGFSDIDKFKSLVEGGNSQIEVRLRQWYPES